MIKLKKIICSIAVVMLMGLTSISPALAKESPVPPKPKLYVRDEAGLLSEEQINGIDDNLRWYDARTGNQISILIVNTTGDEPIEHYSYRVASAWGIGSKEDSNGVLVTVAVKDHKDRIEVGKGLEGTLTDAASGQILRNDSVVSAFRNDDWLTGIASIVNQVQRRLTPDYAGNYLTVSDISSDSAKKSSKSSDIPIFSKAIFFIFCIPFIISLFKFVPFFRKAGYNSKVISGLIYGDAAVCAINMILGLFLTPFLFIGVFLILFFSFGLGIASFIIRMSRQVNNQLHMNDCDQPKDNHGFDGNSNGFNDDADDDGFPFVGYGGFGGGFSSGDSDDGNGFGGGSFGGGGASGGW